jgi:hypothetical protein
MTFEEIGASRRRYARTPTATAIEVIDTVVVPTRPVEEEFVCEACRRDLPLSERSRVKAARCRACA